jgi:hypothetical protein
MTYPYDLKAQLEHAIKDGPERVGLSLALPVWFKNGVPRTHPEVVRRPASRG